MTHIFPFVLIRIAGLNPQELSSFESDAIIEGLYGLQKIDQELHNLSKSISNACYTLIPLEERNSRVRLLNIKRGVNSMCYLNNGDLNFNNQFPELGEKCLNFNKLVLEQEAANILISDSYQKQLRRERQFLLSSKTVHKLQHGIAMSADYFSQRLGRSEADNKKYYITILKYLTRMCLKTTPFSNFTRTAIGYVSELQKEQFIDALKPLVENHFAISNQLCRFFLSRILAVPEVYSALQLRVNPTLEISTNELKFFVNSYNTECIQRVGRSGLIESILNRFNINTQIVYSDLVTSILNHADVTAAEAKTFLNTLISIGLLQWWIPISPQIPSWPYDFIRAFEKMKNTSKEVRRVLEVLELLTTLAMELRSCDSSRRLDILRLAYEELKSADSLFPTIEDEPPNMGSNRIFTKARSEVFSFKSNNIFFEDCNYLISARISKDKVSKCLNSLRILVSSLKCFDGLEEEKIRLKTFFLSQYKSSSAIPILQFYEDYYKYFKLATQSAELNPLKTRNDDPTEIKERRKEIENWMASVRDIVEKQLIEGNILQVTSNEIGKIALPRYSNFAKFESHAAWIQFAEESDSYLAIVNAILPGFGKWFSRFLYYYPEAADELFRFNEMGYHNCIFAESCDYSAFNPNMHPPLMARELSFPGSWNSHLKSAELAATDLVVSFNEEERGLELRSKHEDKRVYIFDLGFQGNGHSELFNLLNTFTLIRYVPTFPLLDAINTRWLAPEKLDYCLPRIIFDDLVIQRMTWSVAKEMLPKKEATETDHQFFVRVNRWRKSMDIPPRVFARAVNRDEMWKLRDAEDNNMNRDDYKPQFIYFESPSFVLLFEHLTRKVRTRLILEEVLPQPEQFFHIHGLRLASEYTLQWYTTP